MNSRSVGLNQLFELIYSYTSLVEEVQTYQDLNGNMTVNIIIADHTGRSGIKFQIDNDILYNDEKYKKLYNSLKNALDNTKVVPYYDEYRF
jgi:hypothetical protein